MSVEIKGFGLAQADTCITNKDLMKIVETSDEWIKERTGIEQRYFSSTENTSDLGVKASLKAIENAKIDPKSIDLIIVATITPDSMMPSTANLVQAKIGLNNQKCLAFDVNAACSGFLIALQNAQAMIQSGFAHTALVIGAETLSKILDFEDRTTCILFGDGAGAVILSNSNRDITIGHFSRSEGDLDEVLTTDSFSLNSNFKTKLKQSYFLHMKGQAVFRFAIKAMEDAIHEICKQENIRLEDIDWIVPHQANMRIIQHVSSKLNIDINKFYLNLNEYGNTSSASIPIALADMNSKGLLEKNQKIILVGFGAGLTWASTYFVV
ncbi:MAG: beta-ketoacyl-ACP synthase III [Erysipelotrichaceae bacterium]